MNWKLLCRAAIAAAVVSMTAGCAEERDPINRVQANALAKSFFVGEDLASDADNPEFYANGTLLDIGYGAEQSGLFDAFYSNDLSIIRWEINEDYLLGRLAYERVPGTSGKGAGKLTNDGQIIYAFKIQSHFDIRRQYNPATGEEMNVVEENKTDRPWNQREYFRVDWSKNLITDAYDFDTLAVFSLFGNGLEWEEVGYYISDPTHEHAPRFEPSEGYFDITTRALAKPGMVDLSHLGWGIDELPACWLGADFSGGTYPSGNCNPVEVSIRHSFWKRQDTDYRPHHWDGYKFQVAGAFTKDRQGFARNYGMSDNKWHRFISRYNVYERSHYYDDPENMTGPIRCHIPPEEADQSRGEVGTPAGMDPTRDLDQNGTDDECEAVGGGSECDQFKQKCTLPYAERGIRPIVWYYTNDSDYRFFGATEWATQEWDVAMKAAIMAGRNAECVRINGENCDGRFPVPHGQMTMMKDAVDIEREVDACREERGTWDVGECADVVEQELAERGYSKNNGDPSYVDYLGLKQIALMDDAVVLCHSPIHADDHPLCAPGKPRLPDNVTATDCQEAKNETGDQATLDACRQAYTVRIGDVRRHLINVIPNPQSPSPWGFGPTYADPLTGEGISASINVWAWPTDHISQSTVDIARFIGGEIGPDQITDGQYVKEWTEAAEVAANGRGALSPMSRESRDERLRQAIKAVGTDLETGESPAIPDKKLRVKEKAEIPAEVANSAAYLDNLKDVRASVDAQSVMAPKYIQRMRQADGTETEAELTTQAMVELAGADQMGLTSEMQTAISSPLRGINNPTLQRELRQLREVALAERGACMLEVEDFAPSPTAMVGMADILQEKFGEFNPEDDLGTQLDRAERMRTFLADRMHYAVMIHEMGHTFGYRHNFVSSSSAMFYRPQYWQLRTKNGQVTEECTDLANSDQEAENCVGPRYFDPVTEEEQDNMIQMWMHSSVMDYAGDYAQDLLGLGAYDFHAARMFYGDAATVYADEDMNVGKPLSGALHETIMDSFGGILGLTYQSAPQSFPEGNNVHYSQLDKVYNLIDDCESIDPETFRPSDWNAERHGEWHPTIDGLLVQVDGQWSRCFQRRVAYTSWDDLRLEAEDPDNPGGQVTGRIGPSIDKFNRTRVPYGFATDRWADLGNLSVYRHDNGADPYEIFEFFITEQELRHIFDNYRRDRIGFSVRSASNRILGRYNEKMRDGAKGMTLIKNNLYDFAYSAGLAPEGLFTGYLNFWNMWENMLAAGMAFDHFARQLQRPNAGIHEDPREQGGPLSVVLRSNEFAQSSALIVPDGPQGFWNSVGIGGKLVHNELASDQGEYDSEYTMNAGSYYDKVWVPMLMSESVDNFISSSLDDFTDSRFRSVSIADLFPDGYRRMLANALTGEDWLKGARVAANDLGSPMVQSDQPYPQQPMGWTTWWTETPQVCFPGDGTQICTDYQQNGAPFEPETPQFTRPIDPQIKWEQQKFLVAMTLAYLPENQKQNWLDMMGIWALGADSDPGFDNRIELHVPNGKVYIARTYGKEEICFEECKTVQRGIAARILEWANELLAAAYVTTPVTQNGTTWYEPVYDADGEPIVRYDSGLTFINPDFTNGNPPPNCEPDPDPTDNDYSSFEGCECEHNAACDALADYISLPQFVRQSMHDFHMAHPSMKGIY